MPVTPIPSRQRDFGEEPVKQGADMICGCAGCDCAHEISLRAGYETCASCGAKLCPDCMVTFNEEEEAVICHNACGEVD